MIRALMLTVSVLGLSMAGGCALSQTSPNPEPITLRVMSYNVHIGVGMDKRRDLPRIAAIINDAEVDLVALQEVDRNTQRSVEVDQAAELAKLTGMHLAYGKAIDLQGGEYGIAVLSRHPIVESTTHPLPNSPNVEKRVALETTIRLEPSGREIRFVCTHFDHTGADRDAQADEVNRIFAERNDLPIILAGDFNARPDQSPIARLTSQWRNVTAGDGLLTFPADTPSQQIDYIFVRPAERFRAVSAAVLNEAVASDHRPIVAVVELR